MEAFSIPSPNSISDHIHTSLSLVWPHLVNILRNKVVPQPNWRTVSHSGKLQQTRSSGHKRKINPSLQSSCIC